MVKCVTMPNLVTSVISLPKNRGFSIFKMAAGAILDFKNFLATVCNTVRPMLSVRCLSCPVCPVCLSVTFVHCGQTVGRIKMKLGMPVGLVPGHIVLDGDPAPPPPKGHSPHPILGPYLLRPNVCMDQDATWHGRRPQPRRLCVRWGPSPLNFRPMFIIVIVISLWSVQVHVLVVYAFYILFQ